MINTSSISGSKSGSGSGTSIGKFYSTFRLNTFDEIVAAMVEGVAEELWADNFPAADVNMGIQGTSGCIFNVFLGCFSSEGQDKKKAGPFFAQVKEVDLSFNDGFNNQYVTCTGFGYLRVGDYRNSVKLANIKSLSNSQIIGVLNPEYTTVTYVQEVLYDDNGKMYDKAFFEHYLNCTYYYTILNNRRIRYAIERKVTNFSVANVTAANYGSWVHRANWTLTMQIYNPRLEIIG